MDFATFASVARSRNCCGNSGVSSSIPMLRLNRMDVENLTLCPHGRACHRLRRPRVIGDERR